MVFDALQHLKDLAARNTQALTDSFGSKTFSGASGGSLFGSNQEIESGLSTRRILNRIEDITDRNTLSSTQFQFDNIFTPLSNLGQGQQSINKALEEQAKALGQQIEIREQQRAETNASISGLSDFISEVNSRLSEQVTGLGNQNASGGGVGDIFGKIGSSLGFGAIGGALAVGAAILIISRR